MGTEKRGPVTVRFRKGRSEKETNISDGSGRRPELGEDLSKGPPDIRNSCGKALG